MTPDARRDAINHICGILDKLLAAYDRRIELLEDIRDYKKEECEFYQSVTKEK